jgi:hypothetical protein
MFYDVHVCVVTVLYINPQPAQDPPASRQQPAVSPVHVPAVGCGGGQMLFTCRSLVLLCRSISLVLLCRIISLRCFAAHDVLNGYAVPCSWSAVNAHQ